MSQPRASNFLPSTRREFLRLGGAGLGLLAFSRFAPSFLVQSTLAAQPAAARDQPILVLIQLAGGNDGLNTLVPFEDDHYRRLRPTLGLAKKDVLKIDGLQGLHPAMTALHGLVQDGKAGIVQNVGYPNPNRSHFRSSEIWETASGSSDFVATGWLGRYLDNACAGAPRLAAEPAAIHLSDGLPQSLSSAQDHSTFGLLPNRRFSRESPDQLRLLENLSETGSSTVADDNAGFLRHTLMDSLVTEKRVQAILDRYQPAANYPGNHFAVSLRNVAGLIAAGLSTRVYFVSLTGFDTHSNQASTHQNLLKTLSEGMKAFQTDLEAHQLDDQVTTMTFSEFGRRPSENESRGTDHGTAAPLFIMGSRVKGGLHGTPASLALQPNQDVTFSTDFRQVYATLLDQWMGSPSDAVLGDKFQPLDFIRKV